jgi:hypothetical protein
MRSASRGPTGTRTRCATGGAQRAELHALLGSALALALDARRHGDRAPRPTVHALPGEPVTFRVDDLVVAPFDVPERLAAGALAPGEWARTCERFGIGGMDLGAFGPPPGRHRAARGRAGARPAGGPGAAAERAPPADRRRRVSARARRHAPPAAVCCPATCAAPTLGRRAGSAHRPRC